MSILYPDSELQMDSKLVLCIEEIDENNEKSPIDTRMFIHWHEVEHYYVVTGRRQDTRRLEHAPFAFNCDSTRDLSEIIQFIVGKNKINVILYNFNKYYGINVGDLTYEFFESQIHKKYEISGYNALSCKRKQMSKYLRMLKNTYNYEPEDEDNPLK